MSYNDMRDTAMRIKTLLATRRAMLLADPMPHLKEMHERCCELLDVLDQVRYALGPNVVFDFAQEHDLNPLMVFGEDHIKVAKAKQILDEYLLGRNTKGNKP